MSRDRGWLRQPERLADSGSHRVETGGVEHGHFSKRAAIEFAADLAEARDQLAVPEAPLAAGGVEPHDPQP